MASQRQLKAIPLPALDGGEARSAGEAPSDEGPSDGELVLAARQGEGWAAEALFRRHVARVDRLAYRLLPRGEDADDLVQDAFVAALDGLHGLDEPEAFGGWLRSIVVRTASKRLRRRRLKERLGLVRSAPVDLDRVISPSAPPDVAAELRAVYGLLHRMPTQVRMTLVLRRVEGLTIAETATALGISEPTVKRRLKQAEALLGSRQEVARR